MLCRAEGPCSALSVTADGTRPTVAADLPTGPSGDGESDDMLLLLQHQLQLGEGAYRC